MAGSERQSVATLSDSTESSGETSAALSLALRVALLESLVLGRSSGTQNGAPLIPPSSSSIVQRATAAQSSLEEALNPHRRIGQFVAEYEHNKPYLVPSISAIGGGSSSKPNDPSTNVDEGVEDTNTDTEKGSLLTPQAQIALLLDAEPDLRELERALRECQVLDSRGVTGAGKLAGFETLVPHLQELQSSYATRTKQDEELEGEVMNVVEGYSSYIDKISQLLILWDHTLNDLESRVATAERHQ